MPRPRFSRRAAVATLWAALATAAAGLPAGPPAANALFPAGGGRGQTVEVMAIGSFDAWPVQAWVHEPGLEIEPAAEKGKFTVRVAADTPPGVHWVRFFDGQGATAPLPFEVGTVPCRTESEPNDGPNDFPNVGPLPAVVEGRLEKADDVDGYAVTLEAGRTLVASLKAHRLGAPMDGVLQVVSADGFVLAQSDDESGLDPRLVFEAPAAGTYVVRCFAFPSEPNSTIGFAGGDRFVYRLTLTTGPFLDHALPLAVPADESGAEVEAFGWNLTEPVRRLRAERTPEPDRVRAWHPDAAETIELATASVPVLVETEGAGQAIMPPVIVSGRIGSDGERDRYRFTAKKGQVWRVRAVARELGSPLDPVLQVLDAGGKVLSEQDDRGRDDRDAEVSFSAPEDGEYRVSIRDLNGRGGPRSFYRLDVTEPKPDFGLTLAEDRFTVSPGKPATVAVTVTRERG
ncbi:MAG TPA: PPC domain-containing protein, partial [Planctomycetaceae bacterium]